jgi:hypothetical protein
LIVSRSGSRVACHFSQITSISALVAIEFEGDVRDPLVDEALTEAVVGGLRRRNCVSELIEREGDVTALRIFMTVGLDALAGRGLALLRHQPLVVARGWSTSSA